MAIRPYRIDPTERLDYALDWTRWLADGETLVASSWVPDTAALTPEDDTFTPTTTHVWLTAPGANAGDRLRISNAVTSSAGRAGVQSLRFEVAVTWPPSLLEIPRVPAATCRVPASAVTASGNAVLAGVASVAGAMSVPASTLTPSPLTLAGVAPVVVTVAVPASDVAISVGEFTMDVVVNFSSGTGALTATKINVGTHGTNWGTWREYHANIPDNPNTHTSIVNHPIVFPGLIQCGGVLYNGSEGQGLTFDEAGPQDEYDIYHMQVVPTFSNCVAIYLVQFLTDLGANSYFNDTMQFQGASNFSIAQYQHSFDDLRTLRAHANNVKGHEFPVTTQWTIVCIRHDSTGQTGEFYAQDASTLVVLGASQVTHNPAAGVLDSIRLHDYLRNSVAGTGSINVKLVAMRSSDTTWPPYQLTPPLPSDAVAAQSGAGEITLTWSGGCHVYQIERNVNAAGWVVEASAYNTDVYPYVDGTVSSGQSVQYRILSRIGAYLSGSVASNTVVVT